MARSLQKLSAAEIFRIKWLIGASMALVSVSSLFNVNGHSRMPGAISAFVIIACICFPKLYAKTPLIVWKLYALSIVPLVSIDVFAKETVPALLNLNTWLVLYRGLNHQKRREEMQLVLLCLFLMVMAGMLTNSLVFGIQILLYSGLAIAFLTLGTILDSKAEGCGEDVDSEEAWRSHRGWWNLAGRARYRNLAIGSAMFAVLLGIAGMAFLFIPRVDVEEKVNLFKMKSAATQTGFSESVTLGEVTNIKKSSRVALRVDISGAPVVPAMPYWRMLALDDYENGSFSVSPVLKEMLAQNVATPYNAVRFWNDRWFSATPSKDSRRDHWTFFMEPGVSKFLPVLGSFKQFTISNLDDLNIGPYEHSFSLKETPTKMVSYQLEGVDFSASVPDIRTERYLDEVAIDFASNTAGSEAGYPDTLLELPDDAASREYLISTVRSIGGDPSVDPIGFASLATQYLASGHGYSLNTTLPRGGDMQDPVVRWMQSDLDGHCEFFASALVLLCRSAGIETRMAIGFKGGAWNAFENYYMVRNSDAHAWVEINDGRGRWFRVDPTPGSGLPTMAPETISLEAQIGEVGSIAYIDSLRMLWYRRIVNFDEQAQRETAMKLKEFFFAYMQVAEEWTSTAAKHVYSWILAPWSLKKFFTTTISLALSISILLFQRNLALNYRELIMAPFRRGDPIRRKASKFLRKRRQPRKGSLIDSTPEREAVVHELQRLRFGPRESWKNPRIVFKEARRLL